MFSYSVVVHEVVVLDEYRWSTLDFVIKILLIFIILIHLSYFVFLGCLEQLFLGANTCLRIKTDDLLSIILNKVVRILKLRHQQLLFLRCQWLILLHLLNVKSQLVLLHLRLDFLMKLRTHELAFCLTVFALLLVGLILLEHNSLLLVGSRIRIGASNSLRKLLLLNKTS